MSEDKIVVCDKCEHEFLLKAVKIEQSTVVVHDQSLQLVYFICPKCGQLYRITLKDERYTALAEDLEKTKKRITRCKNKQNVELARMLDSMVKAKLKRLQRHCTVLNGKYTGRFERRIEDGVIKIEYIDRE